MSTIIVKDVIKKELAVSPEDGEAIRDILIDLVKEGKKTTINFSGLQTITTAFLNSSIGDLYSSFNSDTLNNHITISSEGLSELQKGKIRLVMDNAKVKVSEEQLKEDLQ